MLVVVSSVIAPVCSAKGCRATASWVLVWNNARIHSPDREKRWVACPDHREHLAAFLDARGFLRRVEPWVDPAGDSTPEQP